MEEGSVCTNTDAGLVKTELRLEVKLSIYLSVYIQTFTCGHEIWIVPERMRSQAQVIVMTFLHRVPGLSLRDMVRSSDMRAFGLDY